MALPAVVVVVAFYFKSSMIKSSTILVIMKTDLEYSMFNLKILYSAE